MKCYSYKFRLYPTKKQEILLNKHFGCVRWVYNHFLDRRNKFYLEAKEKQLSKKTLTYNEMSAELTKIKKNKETEWLSEICAQTLQQALKHLDGAYNSFFKKLKRFPKFKSKKNKSSFKVPQNVKIENNKLYITKFKEGILINLHRPIEGKIKNATISKSKSGKYFVSILVERNIQPLPKLTTKIGIDLGIKSLVTCSDGKIYPNIKTLSKYQKRIKFYQKQMSRRKKESKRREKSRIKLAKVYEKVANIRNDHLHKVSRDIINKNQVIVLENLNINGMMQNHKIAKSLGDCSLSELVRQIKYKADWYGREIVQLDRFYPSSKTCSNCGYINGGLTLSDRTWECPRCQANHDRDLNAAKNILVQGENLMNQVRTGGTPGIANSLGVNPGSQVTDCVGSFKGK